MTKTKALCLFAVAAVLLLSFAAQAAAPTAKISLRAVSPRDTVGVTPNRTSTGLPNVPVGSLVYLMGSASTADTVITGYAWTLTAPTGSTATLSDPAIQNPTFSPDIAGQYLVGLVVTDAKGQVSAQVTLWINAGTYVGVGTVGNKTATFPQCGLGCHVQQEQKWHHTAHAELFREGIDGIAAPNYAATCIACHTTGYDRDPAAVNGGFDDVAAAVGWTFPDTLKAGNWDTLVAKYPTLAQLGVIGCENCHGPGSAHGGAHDKNQIHATYDNGPCAVCHDAGTRHFRPYQWDLSAHAHSADEPGQPGFMNRTTCAKCHIAQGFVEETIRGKPSAAPYPDYKPITCAACHDPHDPTGEHQLRRGSVAEACTGCHVLRISSRGLHHSHQTDMLEGKSGWEYPGQVYLNSAHTEIEEKCAVCHMARAPQEPWVLPQDTLVGGHTFRAYNDRGTPEVTDDVVNTWGCVDCHGQVSPMFVHLSQESIKALLDTLKALLPKDATGAPIVHVRLDPKLYTKAEIAGAYNYYFVLNDGSYGVHNHRYAEKLLRDAIQEIKVTAGAGDIVDIADVPNDQGKQVHIIWNAFPAEHSAINPILNYGIWRRNDSGAASGAVPVTSFKEMLTKVSSAKPAGQYLVAGSSVWDFVGFVPAAGHDRYGYVAPTLFDSTKVAGLHWTVFYISGHTSDPTIVYESLPDSGYSVDNLVPTAPTGVVIATLGNQNRLKWDDPVDADFNYFAVYRSTTPNFDPTGTQPVAKVTAPEYTDTNVLVGTRYYYKISAFDFSGNEGKFSEEVSVVTGVEGRAGGEVPKEFALEQNFPNPFNPETLIKFSLPKSAHVRLTVYTLLGQPVRTLIDAERSAGYHQVTWDGKDAAGNPLASGIYVYRIEAGDFAAMKKMIFLK